MSASNPPQPNQNQFKTPISIKDFDILGEFGRGAFGSIYKAKYKINGEIYAIKAKRQDYYKKYPDAEIDDLREKEILYDITKKNHPHVIKLYADFQDDEYKYLVMEFCEGKTLNTLRGNEQNKGYIDQNLVINILTQLLETLSFLHDTCHIMHRDIKPDNIILDQNNNIKLLSFGLSAYLENPNPKLVSKKSLKGEINFVAPEIIFSAQPLNYDYKIDIFSLGFTIYSLMNPSVGGKLNLPQETKGRERIDNNLVNTFYDAWLIDFVKLLYENDQEKRPTAAGALELLKKNPNYKLDTK